MKEREMEEMRKLLKKEMKPAGRAELGRDLWPSMLERLSQGASRVPWWDWALLAGATLSLWFFPAILPTLLYHL
ncbi:MAG TPA: hypothetical protein VMH31_14610 [Methylomirabilota bacterium]|nr:hypothetical protein [Methylomirabilota bacterium]